MKKIVLVLIVIMFGMKVHAQDKNAKATIEVDGVCLMCKERIEKAAIKTKGVKSAVWNVDTHMLDLIFDERKTSLPSIHESVAAAGHDTKEVIASKEAYENLHPCCKYRDENIVKEH